MAIGHPIQNQYLHTWNVSLQPVSSLVATKTSHSNAAQLLSVMQHATNQIKYTEFLKLFRRY